MLPFARPTGSAERPSIGEHGGGGPAEALILIKSPPRVS